MKKRFNLATVIGLLLLSAALTFALTRLLVEKEFDAMLRDERQVSSRLSKLTRILNIIENEFVGPYDFDTLIDGAAEGIIAATGDQWSFYMDAENYEHYMQTVQNSFVGIGTTVTYDEETGCIYILRVHEGSPADNAGIVTGDIIMTVDGEDVTELGYTEAVTLVRGVEGSEVLLGVLSEGDSKPHNIAVTRKMYQYNPISSEIIEGNIGLIRIENFDEKVAAGFSVALDNLLNAGVEGVIFDVRNNGGGLKDEMVTMLDKLCPSGTLFIMRDKMGNENVDYSDANEVSLPMVVLVNENSYSAAEFFAVALQEYGKAQIVGTGTTGKGYSQQTRHFSDGSAINISTNEYFTPSGESLIGKGITPDVYVELDASKSIYTLTIEEDNQLQEAIKLLQE